MIKRGIKSTVYSAIVCLIILFVLTASTVLAEDPDWFYQTKDATIDLDISSKITVKDSSDDSYLESMIVNLSFLPREDWRQQVTELKTEPKATIGDSVVFKWTSPEEKELSYSIASTIDTKHGFLKIKDKISFPLSKLDKEILQYTVPQGNIDSDNQQIIRFASNLAEGEDDMVVVVFKVADWVKNNVEYDLSSSTAEVTQKSSWVLMKREGVCDELTSLFIAMLRSLGIPARYISGVAYTNWNEINDFGPHAWAEVYFPGVGWVPYDVTYGQFGFVDTSHIKLRESFDSNESSARFYWYGRDVSIQTTKLDINAKILEIGQALPKNTIINAKALKNKVGFGSYNLIEAEVKNDFDYYLPIELTISKTQNIKYLDDETKHILLLPKTKKKVYWIVRIDSDLNDKFIYTFPLTLYTQLNESGSASFQSSVYDIVYTKEEIEHLKNSIEEEQEKSYSSSVALNCAAQKKEFYIEEQTTIDCTLKNTGNTYLEKVNICFEAMNSCVTEDVGISQESAVTFKTNYQNMGTKEAIISAKNDKISKTANIILSVLDRPSLEIVELTYPDAVKFDSTFKVSFTLKKLSESSPRFVKVVLNQKKNEKVWEFTELTADREFVITLNAQELGSKENTCDITVTYSDEENNLYAKKDSFVVSVKDITLTNRIIMLFNNVGSGMDNFDLKVLILAAFVFGIVGGYMIHTSGKHRDKKLADRILSQQLEAARWEKEAIKKEHELDIPRPRKR